MSVDLHVAVAVSVQWGEHDAEGPGPVAEQHEQAVSQRLLGEHTPPVVHWDTHTHTHISTSLSHVRKTHGRACVCV